MRFTCRVALLVVFLLSLVPVLVFVAQRDEAIGLVFGQTAALLPGLNQNTGETIFVSPTYTSQEQAVVRQDTSETATSCALPPGMERAKVHAGFEMVVLSQGDIVSGSIRTRGFWEIHQVHELVSVSELPLPPPDAGIFLDIGGNLGYFSLLFAHAGYKVMTVEPMTQNRRALEASLCLNPRLRDLITVFPVALANPQQTSMKCIVQPTNSAINRGNGYLKCGSAEEVDPKCGPGCETVPVKTLDTLLSEARPSAISVVKMDIEGSECNALAGGQSLFKQYRPKFLRAETVYSGTACFKEATAAYGYRIVPQGGETIFVAT